MVEILSFFFFFFFLTNINVYILQLDHIDIEDFSILLKHYYIFIFFSLLENVV